MPRKKPEDLAPVQNTAQPVADAQDNVQISAPAKPLTIDAEAAASMDTNGDGHISAEEAAMELEFKRKALEDADAMRDAQRKMAWFALFGMLLYPFAVVIAVWIGLEQASKILGDMAATYFVSVAAIVAAFFGGQAYSGKQSSSSPKRR